MKQYNRFGSKFSRAVQNLGGLEEISYIVSDSIPFLNNYDGKFISYKDNTFVEDWIKKHPGEMVQPIQSFDELNLAVSHKHDWYNRADMYPKL